MDLKEFRVAGDNFDNENDFAPSEKSIKDIIQQKKLRL
jgi:hypothetical protein